MPRDHVVIFTMRCLVCRTSIEVDSSVICRHQVPECPTCSHPIVPEQITIRAGSESRTIHVPTQEIGLHDPKTCGYCHELAARLRPILCNQDGCTNPAAYVFTWPGKPESVICERHRPKLLAVAAALGFLVHLRPLRNKCARCGLPADVHGHGETGRDDSHPFEAPA